jgi:hypothetical protein
MVYDLKLFFRQVIVADIEVPKQMVDPEDLILSQELRVSTNPL